MCRGKRGFDDPVMHKSSDPSVFLISGSGSDSRIDSHVDSRDS